MIVADDAEGKLADRIEERVPGRACSRSAVRWRS
jgi:hypothetical protein